MDTSSALWLSELEMDDPIISHQSQMSSLDDPFAFNSSFSSETFSAYPSFSPNGATIDSFQSGVEGIKPAKILKTNNWNSCPTKKTIPKRSSSSSSAINISFGKGNSVLPDVHSNEFYGILKPKKEMAPCGDGDFSYSLSQVSDELGFPIGSKRVSSSVTRTPLQAQDHVLSERKRRERLTQKFIALSALVPGLKKMDKASVLGDAAKYITQLQERVKTLEEKAGQRDREEVVSLKRSRFHLDEESSSSDENFDCIPNESIPEIEVRISEKNVLIRVQSKTIPGFTVRMLSEIEKLHMTIVSSSIMPFATSSLLITIIAQMDEEFCMSANDLAKTLQLTCK